MLWVLDLDGVVWLAGTPIPGSPEAVSRLHAAGETVAFVTNNSGPTLEEYVAMLARAGVAIDAGELVTSAQAAASVLPSDSRAAVVGGAGLHEALEARGVEVVPAGDHPDAVVVGRSLQLDFAELAAAAGAIRDGARFLATNTDATFPTGHGLEPGAGALIAYLQVGSGRQAEVAGKPYRPAADLLRARFGPPGVVVGDQPATDGTFATLLGVDFDLVLSGVTSQSDLPVTPTPKLVTANLAAAVDARLGPSSSGADSSP
jgi:HAD superfamily hydrolase (TIGR01450 family)